MEAELDTRRIAEEKRKSEEALLIATLEEQVNRKTRTADDAIACAKAALEQVSFCEETIIASTIAQDEAEAVAEAESIVAANTEGVVDTYEVPPSASTLEAQRWEFLRSEGRSVTT